MNKIFLNISNHPSAKWERAQREAALALGCEEIADFPFPNIPPLADTEAVAGMAFAALDTIRTKCDGLPAACMVQGEFVFTAMLVRLLGAEGVPCYAATTERQKKTVVKPDGSVVEEAAFIFCRFRAY